MADDKKSAPPPVEKDTFAEMVWIAFCIFIILYILNGILNIFNSGSLPSFWGGVTGAVSSEMKTIPLSKAPTLIGGHVKTNESTPLFKEPGVNQIGTVPKGATGTVLEGPMIHDGDKYWHIGFDDGTDGWVNADALDYLKIEKKPLSSISDPKVGDSVSTSKDGTPVFLEPGLTQIATESKSTNGKIVGGPEEKDGVKYWKVHFDDGVIGWVSEDNLDAVVVTPTPISDMPSIIGDTVIAGKNSTAVYDSPGGNKIATKKKGSQGKIIEGPIIKNGVKYWHIKFDDGTDGWVAEDDLEYVTDKGALAGLKGFWHKLITFGKFFSTVASLGLIVGFILLRKKLHESALAEAKRFYPDVVVSSEPEKLVNPQWERILKHSESTHENDWRLAILEADIMLGDLLEKLGLPGDTIGEKLKAVEVGSFRNIDSAWEAHKVRNQIAHSGASFHMNDREAKRIVGMYKAVFEEFKVI